MHSAFSQANNFIIIHFELHGVEQRILGWPFEWPDNPEKGYFLLSDAEWLSSDEDGNSTLIPATQNDKILIPASSVQLVEFVKSTSAETTENGEGSE